MRETRHATTSDHRGVGHAVGLCGPGVAWRPSRRSGRWGSKGGGQGGSIPRSASEHAVLAHAYNKIKRSRCLLFAPDTERHPVGADGRAPHGLGPHATPCRRGGGERRSDSHDAELRDDVHWCARVEAEGRENEADGQR